ncbi:FapA family protein [Desulfosarcina ovata]|uniref:Flagellar Assembly Protein A N-terminal region domain-containing protein n=1 Tax=Desulfosarcina ovata subsp. ovata TaxID=2752305 RepID=A0A5K8AEX4_9BACT|nr:FapA family protein [Desulfosarcina ovata]BBO91253.1 hypothetical protein DSCOOX_44330 [Desulfosarcina ovata subsp. ovata]
MTAEEAKRNHFGVIAVEMNMVDQSNVDRAVVVQARIFEKANVNMPIGEILIEMGVLTPDQRDEILQMQKEIDGAGDGAEATGKTPKKKRPDGAPQKMPAPLEIRIAKDKLTATVYLKVAPPITTLEVKDVKIMLHNMGILHGIADEKEIEALLAGELGVNEEWAIASGTPPVPDAPPQIEYHFDTDPMKIGTLTEDGLMDWKNRGQLPQVKEGALLAEKIPGPKGKEGMDIYGKQIPVPKAREYRFRCGKGARRSEDGMQVHASLSGMPKLSPSGELAVMPTLHIQGDISLETGHVEFDGHIEVEGTIEKDYRVKGGSLRAKEIQEAEIDIDGDVFAENGIFGATICCNGNLKAGHIKSTDIIATGDIAVEREIIESFIEANGRCLINDGTIIASTISAKMGIITMDIGTEAARPSELTVGIDRQLEREADAIKAEIQGLKTEQEKLTERVDGLNDHSDEINTHLGEVAQEQDRYMVQRRRLQKKIKDVGLKQGKETLQKLKNTLQELKSKQSALDTEVARLMEEDDTVKLEIADTEKTVAEILADIGELNERLDKINEAQKTSTGLAIVKIAGTVFSGTKVTGPHAKTVLQEDFKRLSIAETDNPDQDGARRWRFELAPFR